MIPWFLSVFLWRAALLVAIALQSFSGQSEDRRVSYQREAVRLLEEALEAAENKSRAVLAAHLRLARRQIEFLLEATPADSRPEREQLVRLANRCGDLAEAEPNADLIPQLQNCIEQIRKLPLGKGPRDLAFTGSYVASPLSAPQEGGHAASGRPAPPPISSLDDLKQISPGRLSGIRFELVDSGFARTYCGAEEKVHLLESGGSGVALFDYNNDGLLDVYIITAYQLSPDRRPVAHRNQLYRNLGGWKFRNVSVQAGVDLISWGNGASVGDYNDDGFLDLYVTNFGTNFLLRNNGDGTFTERGQAAGVAAGGWSTGSAFFDMDHDGDLDLFVCQYVATSWEELIQARPTHIWRGGPHVMAGPAGMPGQRNRLYRNEGNGTFSDVSAEFGIADLPPAYSFGVVASDLNGDRWLDLYVANDSKPNFLLINTRNGRFQEVALASGAALSADGQQQAGMGVDCGDFDGDGEPDLVVTNFAYDSHAVYRNLGGGRFEEVSSSLGVYARTFRPLGWGVAFFDPDRDGDLDLLFANGHIYPQVDRFPELGESYRQNNQLLLNEGGRFWDISDACGPGLGVEESSRGLALGDLDNDGDLDIVITHMDRAPTVLRNQTETSNHWLTLQVRHPGKNAFAIGARVTVKSGGRRQFREIRSGGSFLSQSDLRTYFGLGDHAQAVHVEVELGSAGRWEWKDLSTDRLITLVLDTR